MRYAAAIPAIAVLCGSAIGLLLPDVPGLVWLTVLTGCAACAPLAWRRGAGRLLVAVVFAGFVAGTARLASTAWHDAIHPPLRDRFEEPSTFATIDGVLREDASLHPAGVSLSVAVDGSGILATVVGSMASSRLDDWRAGRRVRFPVELRRPARYLDPGVPDGERALTLRGTTLVGTVKSGALVDVVGRASWFEERIGDLRAFSRRAIGAAVGRWSARSAGIVTAIVIGDRAGLDPDVQRHLQEAGTYHVIAISGGNIAILAGLMLGAFRWAGWLGRTAMLSSIVALVAYADLVGGGASVDRATLMAVVYFGARVADHRAAPLNTLAVVAACLVVSQPFSIVDPAFVLTFGATLAILLVVPAVPRDRVPRALVPAVTMFAASIATELMLLPIGALFFSRVTFAGLALNFVAIPLMAVAQVAGMALVPVAAASPRIASAIGLIAHAGADGLVRSAELVRFAPALAFRVAPPGWPVILVYYVGIAGWLMWRRRACAGLAICAAAWMLVQPWAVLARRGDGRLHVIFLDVGQGDATFVRFPRGGTLLVDAGGLSAASTFDIGDRVVAPVLRDAGVGRLDYVALTHADPDHVGGALSIVREFRPREIWEGVPVPSFAPLATIRAAAADGRVRWANVRTGDRLLIDEVEVVVRHPGAPDWERQRVRNDDSIVIELRWCDVSVLLTGDIGAASERALATLPRAPLRVLKVPHHGSLTSSTPGFIRTTMPTVAVASVGRANHFGHPAPEVLQRYEDAGVPLFRTDRDGAVFVDTDGRTIDVRGFNGNRRQAFGTRSQ